MQDTSTQLAQSPSRRTSSLSYECRTRGSDFVVAKHALDRQRGRSGLSEDEPTTNTRSRKDRIVDHAKANLPAVILPNPKPSPSSTDELACQIWRGVSQRQQEPPDGGVHWRRAWCAWASCAALLPPGRCGYAARPPIEKQRDSASS